MLEGKGASEAVASVKQAIVPVASRVAPLAAPRRSRAARQALKMNYVVWPAAQLINFTFVPPQHRVGYISGLGAAGGGGAR